MRGTRPGNARDAADELRARDVKVKRADVFGELTVERIRKTASNKDPGESVCGGSLEISSEFIEDMREAAHARAVEFIEAFLSMAQDTGLDVRLLGRLVKR